MNRKLQSPLRPCLYTPSRIFLAGEGPLPSVACYCTHLLQLQALLSTQEWKHQLKGSFFSYKKHYFLAEGRQTNLGSAYKQPSQTGKRFKNPELGALKYLQIFQSSLTGWKSHNELLKMDKDFLKWWCTDITKVHMQTIRVKEWF